MTPKRKVVVVDGSNIATEGRSIPSLVQLDEATRAFQDEEPAAEIIVVVDATFEHRIAKDEQRRFRESAEADEVVTPPAGTIGRGDAFILKIARRANAVVLSNDSFQEFHAEHPWLFDEGRLVGGKPVPGVGWIFAERNPVKGPTSRAVRAKASSLSDTSDAEGTVGNPAAPASGHYDEACVDRLQSVQGCRRTEAGDGNARTRRVKGSRDQDKQPDRCREAPSRQQGASAFEAHPTGGREARGSSEASRTCRDQGRGGCEHTGPSPSLACARRVNGTGEVKVRDDDGPREGLFGAYQLRASLPGARRPSSTPLTR